MIHVSQFDHRDQGNIFIRVDRQAAMVLIKSLSSQMADDNCNGPRDESTTMAGSYFSICVMDEKDIRMTSDKDIGV